MGLSAHPRGGLVGLGHGGALNCLVNSCIATGFNPASMPTGPCWSQFLAARATSVLAVDFITVVTVSLRRLYDLIFVEQANDASTSAG